MTAQAYLVFGDEYRASEKASEIVRDHVSEENDAFGLEIIDGNVETVAEAVDAANRCIEAVRTIGLLDSSKVVWLRNVSFLVDNVIGRSEPVKDALQELAAGVKSGLPPGQVLVVSTPSLDKRYSFYKAFEAAGKVCEFTLGKKEHEVEAQARATARGAFKGLGLDIAADALEAFVLRTGTETRQIFNEAEKLAVYLGQRDCVGLEDVETISSTSREISAWDLADAFGSRDLGRAVAVLRRLVFQKESPIGLIIGLEHRIKDLTIYREALDMGWLTTRQKGKAVFSEWQDVPPDVDKTFSGGLGSDPRKVHPYRGGILAGQARRFSAGELRQCRESVMEAHEKMVTGSVPQHLVLEFLLVGMLS